MKAIILFLIIFTVLNLFSEELLIVRGNGQYPPNEMVINDKLTGLHIDIVKNVSDSLGLEIRFESLPWKRALKMMEYGKADAITYVGESPERCKYIIFEQNNILSYAHINFIISDLKKDEISYKNNISDFKKYNIGSLRGYYHGEKFQEANLPNIYEVDSMEQLLLMLESQRLDVAIINKLEMKYLFRNTEYLKKITILEPSVEKMANYIGFSKERKHLKLAKAFAKELKKFKTSKKYKELLKKYNQR